MNGMPRRGVAVFLCLAAPMSRGETHYVARDSATALAPYTNWATAAQNIQDAIDVAASNDLILVTNGVYDTGGRVVYGSMTNRVVIDKPVLVASVHGPEWTSIKGAGPWGDAAVRCAYVGENATLAGFLLADGNTRLAGDPAREQGGGGAWCEASGVLSNCVLSGNRAWDTGGGVRGGTLTACTLVGNSAFYGGGASEVLASNCTFAGNSGYYGGGAHNATLSRCALSGNHAYDGGGSAYGTLQGCTLAGNAAIYDGGGAYYGELRDCELSGNAAGSGGGGTCYSILDHCTLSGNTAVEAGGGAAAGTLHACTLAHNTAGEYGGGACDSSLTNCVVWSNAAAHGGGTYYGALRNCFLSGNAAETGGGAYGGPANNCTVVGNRADYWSGGTCFSSLTNCIVYYNTALNDPNCGAAYGGYGIDHCCTTPPPPGPGNIATEPALASLSHLSAASPCIGAGLAASVRGADLDGEAWLAPPAMGCDEVRPDAVTGALQVAIGVSSTEVAPGRALPFTALIEGRPRGSAWDFGDGTPAVSNRPLITHTFASPGEYDVTLRAFNETYPAGVTAAVRMIVATTAIHYVRPDNPDAASPFTSWGTAATNIQDAIDAASQFGAMILVTDGHYRVGGRVVRGGLTNRLVIDKAVTVQSVNGPKVTAIWGNGPSGDAAARCAYVGANATLSGFLLTDGHTRATGDVTAAMSGGGVWCEISAQVTNCILAGNSAAAYGGGAFRGDLDHCLLTGNDAFTGGGGAYRSSLNRCVLEGNSAAFDGGGAGVSELFGCVLSGNTATYGGGVHEGTLASCVLVGNSASNFGGGTFDAQATHCTLLNNAAAVDGGGSSGGRLTNCILSYNTAPVGPNYWGSALDHSCATPLAPGAGNSACEPSLASLSHLAAGSPCVGAGRTLQGAGADLDGEGWHDPPSMGCDEVWRGAVTGPLRVAIGASGTNAAAGHLLSFTARIEGRPLASTWDFGDGTPAVSNRPLITHAFAAPGEYDVALRAFSETFPGGVAAVVRVAVATAVVHYVRADNQDAASPFANWATAATNIQDAIDAATQVGAMVLVTDGYYRVGGRAVHGALTNRVALDKAVTVRSVNGPAVTVIWGKGPIGDTAVRCAYVGASATLSGFMLHDGYTRTTGNLSRERSGGGAWIEASGVVSNCILASCVADNSGGGAYGGTLLDCQFQSNVATNGGGASHSVLKNCYFTDNAANDGGGADRSTLAGCELLSNWATNKGGGVNYAMLSDCLLAGNEAGYGGGAYDGTMDRCSVLDNGAVGGGGAAGGTANSCLFAWNRAYSIGGGATWCDLNNCTLVENLADDVGGAYNSWLANCIVYDNEASWAPNYADSTLDHCCTTPLPPGTGNFTNDPQFVSLYEDDLHLLATSPCIDVGAREEGMSQALDLDRHPRLVNWIPDLGAYEYPQVVNPDTDGDGIPNDWEGPHGLDPSVANGPGANADADPFTDWEEYVADTDPTNASSYFRLLDLGVGSPPTATIWFVSSADRVYTLCRTVDLPGRSWSNVPGQGPRAGAGGLDCLQDAGVAPPGPSWIYRVDVKRSGPAISPLSPTGRVATPAGSSMPDRPSQPLPGGDDGAARPDAVTNRRLTNCPTVRRPPASVRMSRPGRVGWASQCGKGCAWSHAATRRRPAAESASSRHSDSFTDWLMPSE